MVFPKFKIKGLKFNLDVNLATKIAIGFALISILFIVASVNTYLSGKQLLVKLQQLTEQVNPIVKHSSNVNTLVGSLEPLILELIDSQDQESYAKAVSKLRINEEMLDQELNDFSNVKYTSDLNGDFSEKIKLLSANLENSKGLHNELIALQQEILTIVQQSESLSFQINETSRELKPLLEDIFFELDNEILISMVHEVAASLNSGLTIIEKIKHVNNQEELDAVKREFNFWIGSYGNLLPSLIFGSDEEYFKTFVKQLGKIYTSMVKLLEGDEGLIALQAKRIEDNAIQSEKLNDFRVLLLDSRKATDLMLKGSFDINENLVNDVKTRASDDEQKSIILGVVLFISVLIISFYLITYFRKSVAFIIKELEYLAAGKIRPLQSSKKGDEFGQLNNSLVTVIENLRKIVFSIDEASEHVNESVQKVGEGSAKTAENMNHQKVELGEVGKALTEMCSISTDVAGHIERTYQKVTDARELSTQGREKVLSSKHSVEKVVSQTREAIEVIDSLDQGVKNIESVMETISTIAEMTNLLALNAAIEAARAGGHGRGFAVVADEVRALANRTQTATKEIRQMTVAMIEESRQAVSVMHRSEELVAESLEQAQDADCTIAEFDKIMDQVKEFSHLIATASDKQVDTVERLNKNIDKVSVLSEHTMSQVKEASKASEKQIEITEELESKVKQFVIKDTMDHDVKIEKRKNS